MARSKISPKPYFEKRVAFVLYDTVSFAGMIMN